MSRVLGIDPGFDRVGMAILEESKLLYSHCIETDRQSAHAERLLQIGHEVRDVIKEWSPADLAIEELFFNKNITNALKVSEARGVVMYEAISAGLSVYEYSPQAIKLATTGYGRADKRQIGLMVQKLIQIPKTKKPRLDDELDAIAVGITHLASRKGI